MTDPEFGLSRVQLEQTIDSLRAERQQAQEERDAALAGAKMPTGYINHLCKERDEARAQRQQAIDALQEAYKEVEHPKWPTTTTDYKMLGAISATDNVAQIIRAALVKLGEKP